MTTSGIIGPNHPIQQRANELAGFHVVPRQLALAGDELSSTADALSRRSQGLEDTHLAADDLGYLGKQEQAPSKYNNALRDCLDHFSTLATTLASAGEALNQIAEHYAAMDDAYYEKFGHLDDH